MNINQSKSDSISDSNITAEKSIQVGDQYKFSVMHTFS